MMSLNLTKEKKERKIICNRIGSDLFPFISLSHSLCMCLYVQNAKILLWESYYLDQKTIDGCSSNITLLFLVNFSIVDGNQLRKKDVCLFLSTIEAYTSHTQKLNTERKGKKKQIKTFLIIVLLKSCMSKFFRRTNSKLLN